MTIITDDYGRFQTTRRNRVSGHIPTVVSMTATKTIELFSQGVTIQVYKAHHLQLITFELKEIHLSKLEIYAMATVWDFLGHDLPSLGKNMVQDIYEMLYERVFGDDKLKRAMAVLTPTGRLVLTTSGCTIPEGMNFPTDMIIEYDLGKWSELSDFYKQATEDDGALILDGGGKPYTVWPTAIQTLAALAGYPYSLYMDAEPYHADFWMQLRMNAPYIYSDLKESKTEIRADDIRRQLVSANLELVNHMEKKEEESSGNHPAQTGAAG